MTSSPPQRGVFQPGEAVSVHVAGGVFRKARVMRYRGEHHIVVELADPPRQGETMLVAAHQLSRRAADATPPERRPHEFDAEVVDVRRWGQRATVTVAREGLWEGKLETAADEAPEVGAMVRVRVVDGRAMLAG